MLLAKRFPPMWYVGQVFLRYYNVDELNASLQTSVNHVVTCQAYVRGRLMQRSYQSQLRQRRAEIEKMCDELQQLVVGVSSQHASIQQKLSQEDRKNRSTAKVCCSPSNCIGRVQWRRQLWGTGARAPSPPSTSNNFFFSSLWSKSDSQIQVLCSLRD